MLPERESRPGDQTGAAQRISLDKTTTSVTVTGASCSEHGTHWPCPLHGCPSCTLDVLAYDDTPLGPPVHEEDDPIFELLDALHDDQVYEQGTCQICEELVKRTGWARYPGWKCELSDCLICQEPGCARCMDTGRVCRWCRRCDEHQLETGADCERPRWSRLTLREEIYFVHSTYDRITGRWSR